MNKLTEKPTEMIWSPALSLPSRAATPPSSTLDMNTDYNNVNNDTENAPNLQQLIFQWTGNFVWAKEKTSDQCKYLPHWHIASLYSASELA